MLLITIATILIPEVQILSFNDFDLNATTYKMRKTTKLKSNGF